MYTLINHSISDIVVRDGFIKTKNNRFQVEKSGREINIVCLPSQITSNGNGSFTTVRTTVNGRTTHSTFTGRSQNNKQSVSVVSGQPIYVDGHDLTNVINEELKLRRQGKSLLATEVVDKVDEGLDSYYIGDMVFSNVLITMAGNVSLAEQKHAGKSLTISINGSGDVLLTDLNLNMLTCQINGSGDITGKNTSVSVATLNINGSGDIKGFNITSSANGMVCGSGDITCSVAPMCDVSKNVYGSGKVKFMRA